MLTQNDRDILRRLAGAYMEYALLPVQKEKRDLWKALNRLAPQRPMVNIDQLPCPSAITAFRLTMTPGYSLKTRRPAPTSTTASCRSRRI